MGDYEYCCESEVGRGDQEGELDGKIGGQTVRVLGCGDQGSLEANAKFRFAPDQDRRL